MSCEFCKKADFGSFRAEVESYGAYISLAGGSGRFPKHEQFSFCPVCGEPLNEPHEIREVMAERDRRKLRAEEADIDGWIREFKELNKRHEDTTQDRDRWKARAEALERAIRGFVGTECQTCTQANMDACPGCSSQYRERWQFDEARFTTDKEATP